MNVHPLMSLSERGPKSRANGKFCKTLYGRDRVSVYKEGNEAPRSGLCKEQ